MSRLLDAQACPDCRAPLDPSAACSRCGLRLQGPRATELWQLLVRADRIVESLRHPAPSERPSSPGPGDDPSAAHRVVAPPAPAGTATRHSTAHPDPSPFPTPADPAGAPPGRAGRGLLGAASVPVVLLSLGGLCLVAFAAVFLAVTWDVIGLAGRTLVMLGLTVALAASAWTVTRRGLKASAETLWVVVGLVLALDVYAAAAVDLVTTDLSARATSTVVGLLLVGLGVAVAVWSRRTRSGGLTGVQLLAALGLAVLAVAQGLSRSEPALAAAVLVGLLLGAAVALRRLRLPWLATGAAGLGVLHWAVLLVIGVERAVVVPPTPSWTWWWPLVVCSAYAALGAMLPVLLVLPGRADLRGLAAGGALLPLVVLLNAEALGAGPTGRLLLAAITVLLLGLLLALAPRTWARGAAPLSALLTGGLVLAAAVLPLVSLSALLDRGTTSALRTVPDLSAAHPLAWLVTSLVLAASVAALAGAHGPGLRGVLGDEPVARPTPAVLALSGSAAVSVLALGALTALFAAGPALWVAVLGSLVALSGTGWAAWWLRHHPGAAALAAVVAAYVGLLATLGALASGSALLLAVVLTALSVPLVLGGWVRDRGGHAVSAPLLLLTGVATGCGAVSAWASWSDLGDDAGALLVGASALLLFVAARPALALPASRSVVEVVSILVALTAVASTTDAADATGLLTLLATVLAACAVWYRRTSLGALAAAAALVVLVVRLFLSLEAPDVATAVVGAVLLLGGGLRLLRDPALPSVPATGPALALVLVPSLLLALVDPVSPRAALVGALALAAVVVGVTLRLAAPFLVGSAALALLVLRQLGPVVDAVERWMLLGLAGVVLLVAGITWEAGLRNLTRARRYVASLR